VIVRCTRKLLDLLGARSVTRQEFPSTDTDWYLDLLWIDRRKCLLLTHAGTLFSVFRADVRTAELRPLGPYLATAVQAELFAERLPLTPSAYSGRTTHASLKPPAAACWVS
jgi:hypothetical protein